MKIINYSQIYEREVVDLWNKTLIADPIIVNKFRKQALFDDNFDTNLCFIAVEDDCVIGFLLATKRKFPYLERGLEETRGWINVMFVDQDYQRQGIGESLVKYAEVKLKSMGTETVTLGAYSPNYFFPGVDKDAYSGSMKFFDKMGYEAGEESYSMCKDLHGYKLGEETLDKLSKAQEAGFYFANFEYKYALELLEFLKTEFGGGWKRNALISMQNDTAENCILLVLNCEQKIVGFCMRMIDGNPMRFGPIGVKGEVRNFGIGGILFDIMQLEMEKRGIYHLYFISTDKPGRRFYERHGVKVFRTYVDYEKRI
ncbi:GNAT family N-acetyltransferase [Clostridium algidicarnis]|uniref:GNAT family N-acetyltransferase n=1 Tax=Clostridium algidicarnis TaxID=37659 RepID=UPI001C0E1042|nr:GNAT family N-acetyltransferase [Clostridium algidicarnis]MBU3227341.1 GNAT family N-acetyltransferase [Clostridium algidicarnis]MBU3250864.1 GNAT family N-acetyltransferase [Clostridium algidicarnis]